VTQLFQIDLISSSNKWKTSHFFIIVTETRIVSLHRLWVILEFASQKINGMRAYRSGHPDTKSQIFTWIVLVGRLPSWVVQIH